MRPLVEAISASYPGMVDAAAAPFLQRVKRLEVPAGSVLFRAGDVAQGFVLVLDGKVGVYLTGQGGRELRLYSVGAGASCIQTTLGLLGGEPYAGEAVTETDASLVVIPAGDFRSLIETSPAFRAFVFRAFGARMADVTRTLEQVAFVRIEARLAAYLLDTADSHGAVHATHQTIATAIGSVREVVSRRIEAMRAAGLIDAERGVVTLLDRPRLRALAEHG
jgi:CRP/FNR family transcriptional regulator, anaerobic regulatory protein